MLLEGIFLPLTTPFYPDGRVYVRKLEHNVDRYSHTPAAGMLVLGQAGEADGLTDAEARAALTGAIGAAAKEKVMLAGVSRESVFGTLALADAAAAAGYDAVVMRAPALIADGKLRRELLTYFQAVSDRSALPVVLLSDADRSLAREVVGELAGHPNVIGAIVDGGAERVADIRERTAAVSRDVTVTTIFAAVTGRMLRDVTTAGPASFVTAESLSTGGAALAIVPPKAALRTRSKRVGFQVLCGSAGAMLAGWRAGASGAVPRLGACAPQGCYEVWQAFKDGDDPLAEEKQQRVSAAAEQMEGWAGIAAMKHGCDLNGYFGGRPRLPLLALNGDERAALERVLSGLRN